MTKSLQSREYIRKWQKLNRKIKSAVKNIICSKTADKNKKMPTEKSTLREKQNIERNYINEVWIGSIVIFLKVEISKYRKPKSKLFLRKPSAWYQNICTISNNNLFR